jgi:hypothetical protein
MIENYSKLELKSNIEATIRSGFFDFLEKLNTIKIIIHNNKNHGKSTNNTTRTTKTTNGNTKI